MPWFESMEFISVYYTHKPGGFCKRLYRLLVALQSKGASVHYLTLDPPPASVQRELQSITIIPFPTKNRRGVLFWIVFSFWVPLYVLGYAVRHQVRDFVVFNPFYSLVVAPAKLLRRGKIVLFLRSLLADTHQAMNDSVLVQKIAELVESFGVRLASTVVFQTAAGKEAFLARYRFLPNSAPLLPNDLPPLPKNFDHRPQAQRPEIVILYAGTLNRGKNVSTLITACNILATSAGNTSPSFQLQILGDGPERSLLESKARSNPAIQFLGWIDDIWPMLAKADLLVHPSLSEGMPNVVLEALASDICVLLSDIPVHREIMQDECALFQKNNAEDLSRKIEDFLLDRTELMSAAKTASERLRFCWEDCAIDIVQAALSDPSAPSSLAS